MKPTFCDSSQEQLHWEVSYRQSASPSLLSQLLAFLQAFWFFPSWMGLQVQPCHKRRLKAFHRWQPNTYVLALDATKNLFLVRLLESTSTIVWSLQTSCIRAVLGREFPPFAHQTFMCFPKPFRVFFISQFLSKSAWLNFSTTFAKYTSLARSISALRF